MNGAGAMNDPTTVPDIHDLFAALTRTTTHRERFTAYHGGTEGQR